MSCHDVTITRSLFDKYAAEYDQTRRQLIPPFDGLYGSVIEVLGTHVTGPGNLLDLGAGTGLLAEMVLAACPEVSITLMDVAPDMLQRAQERLAHQHRSIVYRIGDYATEPLGGPYAAVVSALSIHHVEGTGKFEVFRNIFKALQPGGIFINADQVMGAQPNIERRYRENWLQRVCAAGTSAATLAAAQERMLADRMSTLADQLEWMQTVGFTDVNCWFKDYSFVVYAGVKPSSEGHHDLNSGSPFPERNPQPDNACRDGQQHQGQTVAAEGDCGRAGRQVGG
ncbi:MAG: class I SAM-dependent methyltransferase [Magnetococcales bacterium]|nr:class I SAM-dependent methyltransferase [Magnetococcales bacterium]